MASFELKSNGLDGHIRALSRSIQLASRMSSVVLLEFTEKKVRLYAKSADTFLLKFVFYEDFFDNYSCDRRHKCFLNARALLVPFKSLVLTGLDKETNRTEISVRCTVDDKVSNKIVFKVGAPGATTLTYRICINDLSPAVMSSLEAVNRTIAHSRVELSPRQEKKERFLLSPFNAFAPVMDQVSVICSASEIRFIGKTGELQPLTAVTSEFKHKREDFQIFNVKEDLKITFKLKYLKCFLGFVEPNRIQLNPKYIFEGVGYPAHFIYDCSLFKAHLVITTGEEFTPEELPFQQAMLPIMNGPDESFIVDEEEDEANAEEEALSQFVRDADGDETEEEDDNGYNANESEEEDMLDGNLDRLNTPMDHTVHSNRQHTFGTGTGPGGAGLGLDSIRSEMRVFIPDPAKVREILNLDEDPEEIENVQVIYSSDEGSGDETDGDYD